MLLVLLLRYREKLMPFDHAEVLAVIGFLCGFFSFFVQRKALPYHRYPEEAYLILLSSLVFFRAIDCSGCSQLLRVSGAAGILVSSLWICPQSLVRSLRLRSSANDFSHLLQNDLNSLGGASLDGRVQCIDFTAGCITTLYRMGLTQSTGFLYDCYLFQDEGDPAVLDYRRRFWQALMSHQPDVIVLSNHDCGRPNSFAKVDRWPKLAGFLENNYSLRKEVLPPEEIRWASQTVPPYRYRIYLRHSITVPDSLAVMSPCGITGSTQCIRRNSATSGAIKK